jgi:hypothetical protein
MAKTQKSVFGDIPWDEAEVVAGPSENFVPLESSQYPAKTTRAGFENVLGEQLKAGFSDIAQMLILPFRIPGFETEEKATELSGKIPKMFGVADIGRQEDVVQRLVSGGARALPTVALPGPKGASIFTKDPKKAGEALFTSFGAGAGFEGGLMSAGESSFETPLAIGGALTGGTASTFLYNLLNKSPTAIKNAVVKAIKSEVPEESFNKLASAMNGQQIERILKENPDLAEKLAKAKEIQQLIPGFNPNLFQATGAETVAVRAQSAFERQVERIPEIKTQTTLSKAAVKQKTAELFPLTSSSFSFAKNKIDATETALAALIKNADDKIAEASSTMVKLGRQDLGKKIRSMYESRRTSVREIFNKQYDSLDIEAEALGARLAPQQTEQIFGVVNANKEVFESSPEIMSLVQKAFSPREITDPVRKLALNKSAEFSTVNFSDLRSLSRRVNQDFYSAQMAATNNVPGAARNSFVLNQLKQQVDGAIESLPIEIKDKFFALNSAYDQQYREVFRRGLGGMIGAETKMGSKIKDEDIISKLTKESNVDDFYRVFGQSAETEEFLKNGLIEKFLSKDNAMDASGILNFNALQTFIRQNEGVINKIPSLKSFLSNTEKNMEGFLLQKNAAVLERQALEKSSLAAISKQADLERVSFLQVSNGVFVDLNKVSGMIAAAKSDPTGRALDGMKHLMVEKALDASDPVEFISKNEKAFKRAFGKDLGKVQQLSEAMKMLNRTFAISPPIKLLEGDAAKQAIGSGIPQIQSLVRDRISSVQYKLAILTSRFTQQKTVDLKDNAFIDVFKDTTLLDQALKNANILNSKAASEAAKKKALSGLIWLLNKTGTNMYRAGVVSGTGFMQEQRMEGGREAQMLTPLNLPEDVLQ